MRACKICHSIEVIGKGMEYGEHAICFPCKDKVIDSYVNIFTLNRKKVM